MNERSIQVFATRTQVRVYGLVYQPECLRDIDLLTSRDIRGNKKRMRDHRFFLLLAAFLGMIFFTPSSAFSHAIYLYAWEEDDGQVCANGYFTADAAVKGGTVRVTDGEGALVAEGTTDSNGNWCFPRPAKGGQLEFVLDAGQGHRKTCSLVLEETVAANSPPVTGPANDADRGPDSGESREESYLPAPAARKGKPPTPETGPTARDIAGGIGWIVGIFGIGAYIRSRKKGRL